MGLQRPYHPPPASPTRNFWPRTAVSWCRCPLIRHRQRGEVYAAGQIARSHPAFETTGQTENEVGVAYYFSVEGPLADYTLVYKTATVILSTEIDYEIRDVELP